MAKEALFNILASRFDFEKLKCLDLFSGTGNISYELLSRGCSDITSIEINHKCIAFQKKTLAQWEEARLVKVYRYDVLKYLQKTTEKFDLIFADPPYDKGYEEKISKRIDEDFPLAKKAWLIIEHSERMKLEHNWIIDRRKYGSVNFTIFERPDKSSH